MGDERDWECEEREGGMREKKTENSEMENKICTLCI